jgi:hypothetical protein
MFELLAMTSAPVTVTPPRACISRSHKEGGDLWQRRSRLSLKDTELRPGKRGQYVARSDTLSGVLSAIEVKVTGVFRMALVVGRKSALQVQIGISQIR